MATEPFSAEFVEKLKQATAWRLNVTLGPKFTPRWFCCTDPNEMGVVGGKDPVALINLSPNPSFPGEAVTFDGADSYDPDGSIASYAWQFESATPATSTADTDVASWAAVGEYVVQLIVTDGTGLKSLPARAVQQVRIPAGAYFIGTDTGVYFTENGGRDWEARNSGLTGYDLVVNDLKIDPAQQNLPHGNKTIWIATDGGLFASNDGGQNWVEATPASPVPPNDWLDSPAPALADLTWVKLWFAGGRLFAAAQYITNDGAGAYRSWIYYTDQYATARSTPGAALTWSVIETSWSAF